MKKRTWPYGTVKHGVVASVVSSTFGAALVFRADNEPADGFILLGQMELKEVKEGQRGIITFTHGGPTGGYWRYRPESAAKTA